MFDETERHAALVITISFVIKQPLLVSQVSLNHIKTMQCCQCFSPLMVFTATLINLYPTNLLNYFICDQTTIARLSG